MTNLKERHLFPGANTSGGFFSFFDYIISKEEANRIFCIKGGPGTGKSHLMKKIGAHYQAKGYTVEYHHCSSDDKSLDAVVVKELKVALMDGTAPHIVDPVYPIAIDEVLNMGDSMDVESVSKNKKEIISLSKVISNKFKRAYSFFAAAKSIHEDWCKLNAEAIDTYKIDTITESLKEEIFIAQKTGYGNERHLFGTSFTPSGIITFVKDLSSEFKNKFVLKGGPGFGKSHILKEIGKTAQKKGYFVEYLHDPFIPDRIEHIFIPELSTCILTENEISQTAFSGKVYNIEDFCKADILNKNKDDIEYDSKVFYDLITKGLSYLTEAHELHDDLESFYIDSINFDIGNKIYDDVIAKINKYE
ncbi:PRK06851 family protein [Clostridium chauvoei]|uniref:Nephrocystin 3-like N-terminal domain-containing protein n=2 Tax=Clostridium chauvoei TaxID=46867 RepID=S6EHR8_9CLOT|nr:PRK06851 family protein [Clostridium chauvoei]ATD54144.1 ATPase [Clostridium chauvoei]ATD58176.1 ATPase [Clostridium chauvoei]MBX7281849.1 PRK06851 family protein [Clostridium chauvoei]MBX7284370.1 PRK06851 family protein [Clostridium chauvoei]MBX7286893.1 PRK06851 family protein [Clostridium chauvoei]